MRGSEGYRAAAELIRDRLRDYGLKEVDIISLPADGKIFYGTQRSRPAWNASFAELWEQRQDGGRWRDSERIASWADQPITLAQDSVSGRAEAELVDVGTGASAADYAGKQVRGKLVLVSGQPEAAAKLAVTERGAAGIVSWAQNQRSAWWGEDESLIRWGHLSTWEDPTFAFMVSPARARAWQARLAKGETVRLRAEVKAGRTPGAYLIPTAVIPGQGPVEGDPLLLPPRPSLAGRQRQCQRLLGNPRDRPNLPAADRAKGGCRSRSGPCASSGRARSSARSPCSTRGRNMPAGPWRRSIST